MIDLKPCQSVIILGAGISGLLHLMLARTLGVNKVILTDINEYRLKVAKELGADATINAKEDVPRRLLQENDSRLADQVIVCTGASSAFAQGLACVDAAGTILCFAATQPGVALSIPVNDFWRKSIKIMHSYGSSPQDALTAVELIRKKTFPLQKMITHRLSLAQTGLGFKLVAEARECIKVVIEPQRIE